MARQQPAQRCFEFLAIEGGVDPETKNIVVNGRERIDFIVEEHSELEPRERVGILGIRWEFRAVFRRNEAEGLRPIRGRPLPDSLLQGRRGTSNRRQGRNCWILKDLL